jgi:hypothetical protein
MDVFKWLLVILVIIGVLWAGAFLIGTWRWNRLTAELTETLRSGRLEHPQRRYSEAELDGLPEPVQRFFRAAVKNGAPIVEALSITHTGTFNMGEVDDSWKPFTSRQQVITHRPGFVWDGAVVLMPGAPVRVHDAYVAGEGILHPAILGLVSLTELRGTGDVATGEFMRYFAESAWYPTALLPSQGVVWKAINARSASATLKDGPVTATLTFRFGADGLIESVRAEARGRTVSGMVVPTPWEGRWSDYQRRDGMMVPMRGEVSWLLAEVPKPYWRGTVTALTYEFAR